MAAEKCNILRPLTLPQPFERSNSRYTSLRIPKNTGIFTLIGQGIDSAANEGEIGKEVL